MDLQQFLSVLKEHDDLLVVDAPVDPFLEIAALSAQAVQETAPALLFTNPLNSRFPVLTNALASPRRLAMAMNQTDLDHFGVTGHALLQEQHASATTILPVRNQPPCQEIAHTGGKANFRLLPQMTLWPGDAGPCLTAAVVVTRHPETGRRNAGIYRMQIIDKTRAALGWHPDSGAGEHFAAAKRLGRPLEIAVALGTAPAITLAASFPLPGDVDEFSFAAHCCNLPVELAQCMTVDLMVPANSQCILEGHADLKQSFPEGPFGNHTGWQTAPRECPVFQLQAVSHRAEPIFQAIVPGPPPSESCWMAKAFEPVLRAGIRAVFPDVRDISLPLEGIFQNFLFVSVSQNCLEPLRLLAAMLKMQSLKRFRFLVAVDETVDVGDKSKVLWRIGNCVDPLRDIRIVEGPLAFWHGSATPGHGAKVLVDATLKSHQNPIPRHPDPAFDQRIRTLWQAIKR